MTNKHLLNWMEYGISESHCWLFISSLIFLKRYLNTDKFESWEASVDLLHFTRSKRFNSHRRTWEVLRLTEESEWAESFSTLYTKGYKHKTSYKLNKTDPSHSSFACLKHKVDIGTSLQYFWNCPHIEMDACRSTSYPKIHEFIKLLDQLFLKWKQYKKRKKDSVLVGWIDCASCLTN